MEFHEFSSYLKHIEDNSSRLAKTWHASQILRKVSDDELGATLLLLQGKIYPDYEDQDLGIASKLLAKAIAEATGHTEASVKDKWKELGDLGLVAEETVGQKKQQTLFSETHTVKEVHKTFRAIAEAEGSGSQQQKIQLLSKLLNQSEGIEARYVARLAVQDLRIGIAEGTLRDAVAWAFLEVAKPQYDGETQSINPANREAYEAAVDAVQHGLDRTNDFALVTEKAKRGLAALQALDFIIGKPVKVMLAQRCKTLEEAFEAVGKPAGFEYKYDGMRMQIHIKEDTLKVFTRRLEDVTEQFPEIHEYVEELNDFDEVILDGEAVVYDSDTGKYLPFQQISQRIKRKYDIQKLREQYPVELNVFDVLYVDGEDYTKKPFRERRSKLEELVPIKEKKIRPSKYLETSDETEAQQFFEDATSAGEEGLMVKALDAEYQPGNRVGYMLKYKAVMDDLDLVVVGGEWGQGKRSGWITSYNLACKDGDEYKTVGKVATGLKEKPEEGMSFKEMTELLEPHIVEESGRQVEVSPEVVISVRFEEIQESPKYTSGYALRFPRFVALRRDKNPESANTVEEVRKMYESQ